MTSRSAECSLAVSVDEERTELGVPSDSFSPAWESFSWDSAVLRALSSVETKWFASVALLSTVSCDG